MIINASSVCAIPKAKSGLNSAERGMVGQPASQRGPPGSSPVAAGGKGCVPVAVVSGRSSVSFQPSLVGDLKCRC